jgi:hypothetical protein
MRVRGPHVGILSRAAILAALAALLVVVLGPAVAAGAEAAGAGEKLPSGKEVIRRSIEAIGGKEALSELENRVGEGTFEIKGLGIKGKLVTCQAKPNKNYTRIEIGGIGAIEQGTDGNVVWELNPLTGARIKEGKERAALLLLSHFDESELVEQYEKVECVGTEDVKNLAGEEESCYKVVGTPKEAMPITTFHSRETGLPVKVVLTFPHQMGNIEVENFAGDYREVDGILLAHKNVEKAVKLETHMCITKYEHNVDLPEDRFALPEQIQALVERAEKEAREAEEEEGPTQALEAGGQPQGANQSGQKQATTAPGQK